jgi:Spy/CpxP family protein refolding chaperone
MRELAAENDKALAKILKPDQEKRLKQISYQQQGSAAFMNARVAKALGLTDAQKADIQKINEDLRAERRELFQGGPPDEETRKKLRELEKTASGKVMKVLTGEQKTKWKAMEGEPFKGEIRFGPPR